MEDPYLTTINFAFDNETVELAKKGSYYFPRILEGSTIAATGRRTRV